MIAPQNKLAYPTSIMEWLRRCDRLSIWLHDLPPWPSGVLPPSLWPGTSGLLPGAELPAAESSPQTENRKLWLQRFLFQINFNLWYLIYLQPLSDFSRSECEAWWFTGIQRVKWDFPTNCQWLLITLFVYRMEFADKTRWSCSWNSNQNSTHSSATVHFFQSDLFPIYPISNLLPPLHTFTCIIGVNIVKCTRF